MPPSSPSLTRDVSFRSLLWTLTTVTLTLLAWPAGLASAGSVDDLPETGIHQLTLTPNKSKSAKSGQSATRGPEERLLRLLEKADRLLKDKDHEGVHHSLQEAAALLDQVPASHRATATSRMGTIYDAMERPQEALPYLLKAASYHREGVLPRNDFALTLLKLGVVYMKLDQIQGALDTSKELLQVASDNKKNDVTATALLTLAQLYAAMGDTGLARQHGERCLDLLKTLKMPRTTWQCRRVLAAVAARLRDGTTSLRLHEENLALARKSGWLRETVLSLEGMGSAHYFMAQHDRSLARHQEALEVAKTGDDPKLVASVLEAIANHYRTTRKYEESLRHFRELLAWRKKSGLPIEEEYGINSAMGTVLAHLGQTGEAVTRLKQAVEFVEKLRSTLPSSAQRRFGMEHQFTYDRLAHAQLLDNKPAEALATFELSRSRSLREGLTAIGFKAPPTDAASLQQRLRAGEAILVLGNTDDKLLLTRNRLVGHAAPGHALSLLIQALDQYAESAQDPDLLPQHHFRTNPQDDFRHPMTELGEDFVQLARAVPTPQQVTHLQALSRIYHDALIKPLERELESITRLIIVPSAHWNFFPFALLLDEKGRYLCDRMQLIQLPSLAVAAQLQQRPAPRQRTSFLIIDGQPSAADAPTTAAGPQTATGPASTAPKGEHYKVTLGGNSDAKNESEAAVLHAVTPGSTLVSGQAASAASLAEWSRNKALAGFGAIHIAAPATFYTSRPYQGQVELPPNPKTTTKPSYLPGTDIMQLMLQAELVTLSSYSVFLDKHVADREDPGDLTHALLVAGAKSVLSSLWPVAEQARVQFMKTFYADWLTGQKSLGEALATTQRKFIRGEFGPSLQSPHYWAGYHLVGE